MADLILKTSAGKIWKSPAGKILKAKKFSEIPIQDGLEFWGIADPNLVNIIDGFISEVYDVRGGYGGSIKMIQPNVAYRPSMVNYGNYNYIQTGYQKGHYIELSAKYLTIVAKAHNLHSSLQSISKGLSNVYDGLYKPIVGQSANYALVRNSSIPGPGYLNGTYYASLYQSVPVNDIMIISNILPMSGFTTIYNCGGQNNSGIGQIIEWFWYNRAVSELEIVYNQNCLMQKYGLL